MIVGHLVLCFALVTAQDYMTSDMTPDLGAETDSVYQPGTPGGQWSADEVETTRQRIFQMIHPNWDVKKVWLYQNIPIILLDLMLNLPFQLYNPLCNGLVQEKLMDLSNKSIILSILVERKF